MKNFSTTTIDEYLMGKLTGVALQDFEQALVHDEQLANEVAKQKLALQVIDSMGDQEMMKKINQIHDREMKLRKSNLPINLFKYAAAAIVLFASGLGLWNWIQPPTKAALFAKYYSAPAINFTARSGANSAELAMANAQYAKGNYATAYTTLSEILLTEPTFSKVEFAMAICQFELGNEQQAVQRFSTISNRELDLYRENSIWYLALIHLRQDEIALTKSRLAQLLAKPSSAFYNRAKALFDQLP